MAIAQITVEAVWSVVTLLLEWEITRLVIGISVSLWIVSKIFDFLGEHNMTSELHGQAERGRSTRSKIEQTLHDLEDADFETMYGGKR